jgi:hypothetical protein
MKKIIIIKLLIIALALGYLVFTMFKCMPLIFTKTIVEVPVFCVLK